MAFKLNLKRTVAEQITRLTSRPQQTRPVEATDPHALYESIALGNALADIEDSANRKWSGQ